MRKILLRKGRESRTLRSCVPAFLRSCVPAFLRSCVPAFLRSCVPAFLFRDSRFFMPQFYAVI
ncbi:hypothetical protein CIW82_16600 [Acetobacter tropicalis]|uniref:Uncharacterized protein n=1 Tax=Acetobacter tropicalis TaxID=104102 RepID=A0A291PKV5_9PROT|nr:hypothetical protein CIW82_16600 [Acetobacter tropicalis]